MSLRAALGLAWLWTLTATCMVADWLPVSIADYYQQPLAVGIAFVLGIPTFMAVPYYIAFAAAYRVRAALPAGLRPMAAEMVSEIEPARSLVWYAAYAHDAVPRDAPRAAAMAKACLSEVYSRATNRAVRIHGGIGFTWEHDIHFWFKPAKSNEYAFGDAA